MARRWLWLIAASTLLAAGLGYRLTSQLPRVYESTAELLIMPGQVGGATVSSDEMLTAERLTRTYSEMLRTHRVLEPAVQEAGLDVSFDAALRLIDVRPLRDTQILQITARGSDPDAAARLANSLSTVFIRQVQADRAGRSASNRELLIQQADQLATDIAQRTRRADELRAQPSSPDRDGELARIELELSNSLQPAYQSATRDLSQLRAVDARSDSLAVVLDPATPSAIPVQPRVLQSTLLIALAGLALAMAVAFVLEYLDDRLTNPERVTRFTGLHTLGSVALSKKGLDAPQLAEAFRLLRANLQFAAVERPLHTLLITSCGPGDGKSTTAANLARVAAQGGTKVLLIDGDLRRPTLHTVFEVPQRTGLSSLLVDPDLPVAGALQATGIPGLQVLPSGPLPPNPGELLATERMRERLNEMRGLADLVILDSSPVLPVSDPAVLAGWVDGVLLVVNAKATRGHYAVPVVATLRDAGARVLGVVLNRVPPTRSSYYSSYAQAYESKPMATLP